MDFQSQGNVRMGRYISSAALLLLLSACADGAGETSGLRKAVGAANAGGPAALERTSAGRGFASYPDKGDLIGYPANGPVRQVGAATWHRAYISEAHAIRGAVTGEMVVTTPNGQPIRLRYDHREEHGNGNWTWFGRDAFGAGAVVTFGEKAVFGTIPRGAGRELQLTMLAGQSWVVEADPAKENHPATRRADYLVPPKLASRLARRGPAASAIQAESGAASTGTTIDIVLGYTTGLVTEFGGTSQTVTRLQNLIDITNQALDNSQVAARVRLVQTVQVSYPDATSNNDTLEKLTGYQGATDSTPGGQIPVDPAFTTLRAARDQYGADLVSLVRRFRTPENDGCGIAWLIGGDQSGISTSDNYFGYSVVADHRPGLGDVDEGDGKTYVCRQETLAHELGHNMGQAHNAEDSTSTGAHSYSYGYREASSTGFYTVMAYRQPNSSQTAIPYFANPRVTYDGRVTGTASADNALSLGQTMPLIAGFRAVVVPLGRPDSDFNGDGKSDILWRNLGNGTNTIWRSADSATTQAVATVGSLAWRVVGVGDFDGDGRSDILWRNSDNGSNAIWRSANVATTQAIATAALSWQVAGVGDFNGDNRFDVLWRNADGRNVIWQSGNSTAAQAVAAAATPWRVAGVGDFNGDGLSDILWRNNNDGRNVVWRSGNSASAQAVASAGVAWNVAGIGDFDGDGYSDILWRNGSDGRNAIWRSAIATASLSVATVANQAWKVAKVGDFDGDGRSDLLWRLDGNGQNVIWRSANSTTAQTAAAAATAWVVAG